MRKRWIRVGFGLFVFLGVLLFVIFRWIREPATMSLLSTETVEQRIEGRGAVVYYAYAPEFLSDVVLESSFPQEIRYRIDTPLFPLTEEVRQRMEKARASVTAKEKEYIDQSLKKGQVLMPFSGLVSNQSPTDALLTVDTLDRWEPGDLGAQATPVLQKKGVRFIDNRVFYIAFDIPARQLFFPLKPEMDVKIDVSGGETLDARIDQVKTNADGTLCILSLRDGVRRLNDHTIEDMTLILGSAECFRIPLSAVVSDQKGEAVFRTNEAGKGQRVVVDIAGVDLSTGSVFIKREDREGALKPFDTILVDGAHGRE